MNKEEVKEYVINCPTCGSTFDCRDEIKKWVESLNEFKETIKMLKSLAMDKTAWEIFK